MLHLLRVLPGAFEAAASSTVARTGAGAGGTGGAVRDAKVAAMPMVQLWGCLVKLSAAQRHKAVGSLGHVVRQRLRAFLLQRVMQRQPQPQL